MKKYKYKIGDKVIPIKKTFQDCLKNSVIWYRAKQQNQNFLYITRLPEDNIKMWGKEYNCYVLDIKKDTNTGDYFNENDFILYKDRLKQNNQKGKVKKIEEVKILPHGAISQTINTESKHGSILYSKKELKNDAGNKFDGGKIRLDLLSLPALMGTGRVLTKGAFDYGDWNWEKGLSFSRIFGAILRHSFALMMGEDRDPKSGEYHAHHISCEAMFLSHFFETKTGNDDRKKISHEKINELFEQIFKGTN